MTSEADSILLMPDGAEHKIQDIAPADISFHTAAGESMMRITPDAFYVRGVQVEQGEGEAQAVYEAFKTWLALTKHPRFHYLILDTFDGCYSGTNSRATAESFLGSDDHFVVDASLGLYLPAPGESLPVRDLDSERNDHEILAAQGAQLRCQKCGYGDKESVKDAGCPFCSGVVS